MWLDVENLNFEPDWCSSLGNALVALVFLSPLTSKSTQCVCVLARSVALLSKSSMGQCKSGQRQTKSGGVVDDKQELNHEWSVIACVAVVCFATVN